MSFPSQLQDLMDEGRVGIRSMALFMLRTGIYGFWSGRGTLNWNSQDYWGNTLITVSDLVYSLGTAAASFTIELTEHRESGLTPDVLASIENEDYKGCPLMLYEGYFHPDTGALLHVEPAAYGYIDTVDHVTDDNGESKLVGNILSGAIDNHRDGYRSASNEDQQLIAPGDRFFEHASVTKHEKFDIKLN